MFIGKNLLYGIYGSVTTVELVVGGFRELLNYWY